MKYKVFIIEVSGIKTLSILQMSLGSFWLMLANQVYGEQTPCLQEYIELYMVCSDQYLIGLIKKQKTLIFLYLILFLNMVQELLIKIGQIKDLGMKKLLILEHKTQIQQLITLNTRVSRPSKVEFCVIKHLKMIEPINFKMKLNYKRLQHL